MLGSGVDALAVTVHLKLWTLSTLVLVRRYIDFVQRLDLIKALLSLLLLTGVQLNISLAGAMPTTLETSMLTLKFQGLVILVTAGNVVRVGSLSFGLTILLVCECIGHGL